MKRKETTTLGIRHTRVPILWRYIMCIIHTCKIRHNYYYKRVREYVI